MPAPPTPVTEQHGWDLHRLGEELKARTEDVLRLTVERTRGPEHDVDAMVQDSFERIGRSGQGFLFARPLDVAAIEKFLQDWANSAPRTVV